LSSNFLQFQSRVDYFNENNTLCRLKPLTKTNDFPDHYFLGVLKVESRSLIATPE